MSPVNVQPLAAGDRSVMDISLVLCVINILCFTLPYIVTFTVLLQCLVPAVADEPTAHVVPFLYPFYKLFN